MHANIYGGGLNATNANSLGRTFDAGLGTLIADLKQEGLLDRTLIVAMGEFGRTLGAVNAGNGRDHFQQQAALVAGAGIRGGRALGTTDERGARTDDPGWSRERDIRAEDIGATIYSALGIDWTTVRRDDPSGRGFEYIPSAKDDLYRPILAHQLRTLHSATRVPRVSGHQSHKPFTTKEYIRLAHNFQTPEHSPSQRNAGEQPHRLAPMPTRTRTDAPPSTCPIDAIGFSRHLPDTHGCSESASAAAGQPSGPGTPKQTTSVSERSA